MCLCNFACKGRPRNDLYCVGRDVKLYSLTHSRMMYDVHESNVFKIRAWNAKHNAAISGQHNIHVFGKIIKSSKRV